MKNTIVFKKYKNNFTDLKVIGWIMVFLTFMNYLAYKNATKTALEWILFFMIMATFGIWILFLKNKNNPKNVINLELKGKIKKDKFIGEQDETANKKEIF